MKNIAIFVSVFILRSSFVRFCIAYTSLDFNLIFKDPYDRHIFIVIGVFFGLVWGIVGVGFYNDMKKYNLFT